MANFHWANYLVLVAYIVVMVGVGAYFARGQKTAQDYLLAGRAMAWLPIAISVVAANCSAISYLGMPSWTYQNDMTLCMVVIPSLLIVPILNLMLPFYARLKVFTIYEYLEVRFNSKVRTATSLLYLVSQGLYLGVIVYAPALVFSLLTGFSLNLSILIMAIVTILYTTMGGIKAVIWTDFIQFFVSVGGVLIAAVIILRHIDGGWPEFWHVAQQTGKLHIDISTDLTRPFTFWGVLIGLTFSNLAQWGTNQTIVQRFLTASSLREEKKALWLQNLFLVPYTILSCSLGPLLFVFYRQHPALLNPNMNPDMILPHFIIRQMPVVISGLVIAGIFSAAMSAYSSNLNALTTATLHDIYRRYFHHQGAPPDEVKIARMLTVFWGICSGLLALGYKYMGSLVTIDLKVMGPLAGMVLGVFLLGMFTKRTTAVGVFAGVVLGSLATYSVILLTKLSFLWYTALGCIAVFACGYLASLRRSGIQR